MYLQKIKKNEFLSSFIIGTLLAFSVILYKNFFLGGFLYKNYESLDYIRPALSFLNNFSFIGFLESLNQRLPAYPLLISFILKIFGEGNYFFLLIANSLLFGLTSAFLMKIKSLFIKELFWLSLIIIIFNLNLLWISTIILPDILFVFFLSSGLFFLLKFIKKFKNYKDLYLSLIIFGFAYITKPIAQFLPFFLSFYLLFFLYSIKRSFNFKLIYISLLPIVFSFLIASPLYLFNYKNSGKFKLTYHEGGHLLTVVYPCLVNKTGCGVADPIEKKKALNLGQERINEIKDFNIIYNNKKSRQIAEAEIYKEVFYELIRDMNKLQIIQSSFFAYSKLMLHTSLISVFEDHKKSYSEFKFNLKNFKNNINFYTFFWIIFQLALICLRLLQLYGLFLLFKIKENKWISYLLILIMIALIFPTVGIGNFRYRLPIEPILIFLSIIGIENLIKEKKST